MGRIYVVKNLDLTTSKVHKTVISGPIYLIFFLMLKETNIGIVNQPWESLAFEFGLVSNNPSLGLL